MTTILTVAAVAMLATSPNCGAVTPDVAKHLVATATQESGRNPYAIHVNGPGGGSKYFKSEQEAIAYAYALDAVGTDYDAGLLGINRRQFERHHLTPAIAFDQCRNMAAGAEHLTDDYQAAVWAMAHNRYNCGGFACSPAYANAVMSKIPDIALPAPLPPCAPAWDAWALALCSPTSSTKGN